MQTTSALYKEIWADQNNCIEDVWINSKFVTPDGTSYTQYSVPISKNLIRGIDLQRSCYGQYGQMQIGRALSATLEATFLLDPADVTPDQILANGIRRHKNIASQPVNFDCSWFSPCYKLKEIKATGGRQSPRVSESLSKGKFYLSDYSYDSRTNFWKISAADKMAFLDATVDWYWNPVVDRDAQSDVDFLSLILTPGIFTLPLDVDSRTYDYMDQAFPVTPVNQKISDGNWYVQNITVREALGNLAALYGGNFIITAEEKLLLVPFWKADNDGNFSTVNSGGKIVGEYSNDDDMAYTGVVITTEDGSTYTAGNMDNPLAFDCPWGSQAVASFLYGKIQGKTFSGYNAPKSRIDPATEPGDYVVIGNATRMISSQAFDLRPGGLIGLGTPTYPSQTEGSVYNPGMRSQMRSTARSYSDASAIKRYETRSPITDAYLINQSNWDILRNNGTWEPDVLYLPIQGL